MRYIAVTIDTDPDILQQLAFDYLVSKIPGWQPADGNLDVWVIEANSFEAAEVRDIASQVPDTIFRYFGNSLLGVTPIDESSAASSTTWTSRDNVGHTIPSGTQVVIRDPTGEAVPFVTLNEVTIPPGATVTQTGEVVILSLRAGSFASGLGAPGGNVELLDVLDWVSGITMTQATTGGVDAELDDVYLDRLREAASLLSPRPILPDDFAKLSKSVAGVWRALAIDLYNPNHNLMTANQASLETSAAGWTTSTGSPTLTRTTTQFHHGLASLQMTSTGTGLMRARMASPDYVDVVPGELIKCAAWFRPNSTVRSVQVALVFLDAALATISDTSGTAVVEIASAWVKANHQVIAPPLAAHVRMAAVVVTTAAAEVHYVDEFLLNKSGSDTFAPGGTAAYPVERMVTVVPVDVSGEPVSALTKQALDDYLQQQREINFIVNVFDPTYTAIDVQTDVTFLPGYTPEGVEDAVTQAITNYLDPALWGIPFEGSTRDWQIDPVIDHIYHLEMATVINNVLGVDRVVTLTMARAGGTLATADVGLVGVAPMPRPGTITVDAVEL
jgi:hypothetical protein